MDEIVVVNGKRTPFGRFGGSFHEIPSFELGGLVIRKVVENLPIDDREIDYVMMGLCLPGLGLRHLYQRATLLQELLASLETNQPRVSIDPS